MICLDKNLRLYRLTVWYNIYYRSKIPMLTEAVEYTTGPSTEVILSILAFIIFPLLLLIPGDK